MCHTEYTTENIKNRELEHFVVECYVIFKIMHQQHIIL